MATSTKTTKKELNLDEKIKVRNIASWEATFVRRDNNMDVRIAGHGTYALPRSEVIAQCNSNNRLMIGTDGLGSHATLIIEDDPTRIELGFISEDGSTEQLYYNDGLLKKLFSISNHDEFESEFKRCFVERAEYFAVLDGINRLGLNDYRKIRFIEKYTGLHL